MTYRDIWGDTGIYIYIYIHIYIYTHGYTGMYRLISGYMGWGYVGTYRVHACGAWV